MSISIRAAVVDLTQDTPRKSDIFFVDSNVWYWFGYTNASLNSRYNQSNDYPAYINQALNADSKLYKCTLSFAELAHSIERSERELFNAKQQNRRPVRTKEFRHDFPSEREKVVSEIEAVWQQVEAVTQGQTVEVNVSSVLVSKALTRLRQEALDGYDAFMVEALLTEGISSVITDDGDFGQVADITVFTANRLLIEEARKQGQLIHRSS